MNKPQNSMLAKLLLASMFAFSANAMAASENIDYDHSLDLSSYKTFQMADTSKGALAKASPLLDQRVKEQIIQHLTKLGMTQVTDDSGDAIIIYDASTKESHVLNTVGAPLGPVGIGFGRGWARWGGMGMRGMATTTESTFTDGTLVIDSYEPNGKTMIWRGVAETDVTPNNSEKNTKHVTKALDKLFEKLGKVIEESKSSE